MPAGVGGIVIDTHGDLEEVETVETFVILEGGWGFR